MVRSYVRTVKFKDVNKAISLLKPSRTAIPRKKLSVLSDLWRAKIRSVKLYAMKLSGSNYKQMLVYLGGAFSWRSLARRIVKIVH